MKTSKFLEASEISSASHTTVNLSPNDQATFDTVTALKNFIISIKNLPYPYLDQGRSDLEDAIHSHEMLLTVLSIKMFQS